MENKRTLKLFLWVFAFVSIYQLIFTWKSKQIERDIEEYAQGDKVKEKYYIDSISNLEILNLGIKKYTYNDIREQEINLGLDLKGGMNVLLEVSEKDVLIALSKKSKNPLFNYALDRASDLETKSSMSYIDLFYQEFKLKKNRDNISVKLSDMDIFGNKDLRDKITPDLSDDQVIKIIKKESSGSIDRVFEVLRNRIDKFGIAQPNIQKLENYNRILIELPGAKDAERIKKILQSSAKLEFWEAFENTEVFDFLIAANDKLRELEEKSIIKKEKVLEDTIDSDKKINPLFEIFQPNQQKSPIIGYASQKDIEKINTFLARKEIKSLLPAELRYVKFCWEVKPIKGTRDIVALYALKGNRDDVAPLEGDVIESAEAGFDDGRPNVSMSMNRQGTEAWKKLTEKNIGKYVAISLDNYVYSAPVVNDVIPSGRSVISGNFTSKETNDLSNILKSGKLVVPAKIVQAEVVGPSLGKESINKGMISFIISFVIIFLWMASYYSRAGLYSNVALMVNMLFLFGVLSSLGLVLTLPGIAGIILTIAMSIDANIIIYERIKEELEKGKLIKQAVADGYKKSYSSILDANITTFLVGIILLTFGTGPIKGFATSLVVGIITSLISAIFITRLFIEAQLSKNKEVQFFTSITKNLFKNNRIPFLSKKKIGYIVSSILIIVSLVSLSTRGLNKGVDFVGGRTFIVRYEKPVNIGDLAKSLSERFVEDGQNLMPEVKVFGYTNQVKITTKYKINSTNSENNIDEEINTILFESSKTILSDSIKYEDFVIGESNLGILESTKVESSVAKDIKSSAIISVTLSLIVIFLYILIRFRKWEFSMGAVTALFHDVIIVMGAFSLLNGILPFSLEIDQTFIAAILTVIGYSLNDTVIIFDKIREYTSEKMNQVSKSDFIRLVDISLNKTLSRTINTSFTTLLVLLAMFLFGGDNLKGFMFSLIIGILVGTYSSIFIASPIVVDIHNKKTKK